MICAKPRSVHCDVGGRRAAELPSEPRCRVSRRQSTTTTTTTTTNHHHHHQQQQQYSTATTTTTTTTRCCVRPEETWGRRGWGYAWKEKADVRGSTAPDILAPRQSAPAAPRQQGPAAPSQAIHQTTSMPYFSHWVVISNRSSHVPFVLKTVSTYMMYRGSPPYFSSIASKAKFS